MRRIGSGWTVVSVRSLTPSKTSVRCLWDTALCSSLFWDLVCVRDPRAQPAHRVTRTNRALILAPVVDGTIRCKSRLFSPYVCVISVVHFHRKNSLLSDSHMNTEVLLVLMTATALMLHYSTLVTSIRPLHRYWTTRFLGHLDSYFFFGRIEKKMAKRWDQSSIFLFEYMDCVVDTQEPSLFLSLASAIEFSNNRLLRKTECSVCPPPANRFAKAELFQMYNDSLLRGVLYKNLLRNIKAHRITHSLVDFKATFADLCQQFYLLIDTHAPIAKTSDHFGGVLSIQPAYFSQFTATHTRIFPKRYSIGVQTGRFVLTHCFMGAQIFSGLLYFSAKKGRNSYAS